MAYTVPFKSWSEDEDTTLTFHEDVHGRLVDTSNDQPFKKILIVLKGYNDTKIQGLRSIKLIKDIGKLTTVRRTSSVGGLQNVTALVEKPTETMEIQERIEDNVKEKAIEEIKEDTHDIEKKEDVKDEREEDVKDEREEGDKDGEEDPLKDNNGENIKSSPQESMEMNESVHEESKKPSKVKSSGKKPSDKPLQGVTISVSGIGSERSKLKTIAFAMGAEYNFNWDSTTKNEKVLIVDKNYNYSTTPKYKQAFKEKAKIVDQAWLYQCEKEAKKVPYTKFLVKPNKGKESSDEEESDGPNDYDYDDGFVVDDELDNKFEEWKRFVKKFVVQEKAIEQI